MRKVILGAGISLDGYIARADGGIDFLRPPKGYSMAELFSTIDVVVFGRKTYDEAVRLGGGTYRAPLQLPTYVFSKTVEPGKRGGVIFTHQAPAKFANALRRKEGKHIFVMGGGELARSFLAGDVVDELHLGVYPVLLGDGIPFFPRSFPQREFRLAECQSYKPDGFLELRYVRARP